MDLHEKNYELVFEENFKDGLEKNKWTAVEDNIKAHIRKNTDVVPSHVVTAEAAKHEGTNLHFKPENIYCDSGELVVRAGNDTDGFQGGKVVCNGCVMRYGYVEATVKLPKFQKGVWPLFSLEATAGAQYKTIIEIAQVFGDKGKNTCGMRIAWTDEIYETKHNINCLYSANNGYPRFYPAADSEEILSEGYHKFGMEWTKELIIFYCDGNEYCRVDIADTPYIVFQKGALSKLAFSMSIGLPNIDPPELDADFPTEFRIADVKVYQNENGQFIYR